MLDTIGHCPHQILLFEEKSWRHSKTQSLSGGFRSSLGWRRSHHHHPHHDHDHPQHPLRDYQVAQVKGGNGGDWVAVDAREMPKELAKKEDNNETLESSGYSSGEKDETNVIYYKVPRPTVTH